MARKSFDHMMGQLKDEILILGSMVEQSTMDAVGALARRDARAALVIQKRDQAINEKRYAIENAVLIQMATQQPMARDLRLLAAILEVINELERMGDYAKGIAKVVVLLENEDIPVPVTDFQEMARLAVNMLHNGLTAFVNEDTILAHRIPQDDDQVDAMYNTVYRKVTEAMIANPQWIDQSNYLMWVAHNLERLADRVVNICERTLFIRTGELMEMDLE
jgi:phosphate transport system protein